MAMMIQSRREGLSRHRMLLLTGNMGLDLQGARIGKLDIEVITRAIQALPPEFRDTVALATLEEMSYQEIAETLEIPVGTVRSRLSRGRKLLQRALWEYLNGEETRG